MAYYKEPLTTKRHPFLLKLFVTNYCYIIILVSLVFSIVFHTIKGNLLEQTYTAEAENIYNINHSYTLIDDFSISFLTKLFNNKEFQHLIYNDLPGDSSSINAMYSFYDDIANSLWIDSAYIYSTHTQSVVYTYSKKNNYYLSFSSIDEFWDKDFALQLHQNRNNFHIIPQLREIVPPHSTSTHQVITYYIPIQNTASIYDALYVINISVDRMFELYLSTTNNSFRQIIMLDNNNEIYYTNNTSLLNNDDIQKLSEKIYQSEDGLGHYTLKTPIENIFCTWYTSADSPFSFISCVQQQIIFEPLNQVIILFIFFYCSTIIIFLCSTAILSYKSNNAYVILEKKYVQISQQYNNHHSYIKDAILRNFLMAKEDYSIITEYFLDNKIYLTNYTYYSLVLMESTPFSLVDGTEKHLTKNPHIMLQDIFSHVFSNKYNFELVDLLHNRLLLIIDCKDANIISNLMLQVASELSEKYKYSLFGLLSIDAASLNNIPRIYQHLIKQFELLYFYPKYHFVDSSLISNRNNVGYDKIDAICIQLIQTLKAQHFDQAIVLLSDFFDDWFEPLNDAQRTTDYLTKELSIYISTLSQTYAITMNFDVKAFQNNISHCCSSSEVKILFLNLIKDIQSVFAGTEQRSNYIDKVIEIIHKEYSDSSLSMDIIAAKAGLSASHMQAVFKSSTGISVSKYLRYHRLHKSTELLSDTSISINEIADQTGFGNANYFYTAFKKHYTITPNEYRMQQKANENAKEMK